MFILPFTHTITKQNNFEVITIKLLTIGGKQLWKEKSTLHLDRDILNPNDIYRKGNQLKIGKSLHLCEVDLERTNISDFYKWDELDINDSETFCWKSYVYLAGNNGDSWLTIPSDEKLGKYSIKDIINTIVKRKI
jgi:hypothetical protein